MAPGQTGGVSLRSDWPIPIDNFFLLSLLFSSRSVGDRFSVRLIFCNWLSLCLRHHRAQRTTRPSGENGPIRTQDYLGKYASVEHENKSSGKRALSRSLKGNGGKSSNIQPVIAFKNYRMRSRKSKRNKRIRSYFFTNFVTNSNPMRK